MTGGDPPHQLADEQTVQFARHLWNHRETTSFENRWLGLRTLQNPFDVWVIQEIIHETRPDVIIETGTFAGGGAALWASLLAMVGSGRVVSIDRDSRIHQDALDLPIVRDRVDFVTGSSSDPQVAAGVASKIRGERVMVILDSDHSHDHVVAELDAWSPLVTAGCYLVVQDGGITAVDPDHGPGPFEAICSWLPGHPEFEADRDRERMLLTFCPLGFLRRRPTALDGPSGEVP